MLIERQKRLSRVRFRHPIRVVTLDGQPRVIRTLTANVSRKGLFLRMPEPLPLGTKVALSLEAGGRALALAQAEVVWGRKEESQLPGRYPGCGVRFTEFMHPRASELVDYLVHNLDRGKPLQLAPPERRWTRWLPLAAVLALVLCGAAAVAIFATGDSDEPASAGLVERSDGPAEEEDTTQTPEPGGALAAAGGGLEVPADAAAPEAQRADVAPAVADETRTALLAEPAPAPSPGAPAPTAAEAPMRGAPAPASAAAERMMGASAPGTAEARMTDAPAPATAEARNTGASAPGTAEARMTDAPAPATAEARNSGAPAPATAEARNTGEPTPATAEPRMTGAPASATAEVGMAGAPSPATSAAEPRKLAAPAPAAEPGGTEAARAGTVAAAGQASRSPPPSTAPKGAHAGAPAADSSTARAAAKHGGVTLPSGAAAKLGWKQNGAVLALTPQLAPRAGLARAFVLADPPRAVFDLAGPPPDKSHQLPVAAPHATAVRLGRLPTGTRVVVDLDRSPTQVTQNGATLLLTY